MITILMVTIRRFDLHQAHVAFSALVSPLVRSGSDSSFLGVETPRRKTTGMILDHI
jgi:hypothetical protein